MWSARRSIADAAELFRAFAADDAAVAAADRAAALFASCLRAGGKVLACGNGGSCCDAAHFAEELTGRFRNDRPPIAALACAEPGHITCTANDYGYAHVFERWVRALGRPGDGLLLLSTSGNSGNVVLAAHAAKQIGLRTVALLGKGGGSLRGLCDAEIIAPGHTADRIQEIHKLLLHTLVEGIEAALAG